MKMLRSQVCKIRNKTELVYQINRFKSIKNPSPKINYSIVACILSSQTGILDNLINQLKTIKSQNSMPPASCDRLSRDLWGKKESLLGNEICKDMRVLQMKMKKRH